MNKTEHENKNITVYWWNFGKKTLDYKGTYKGYLDKRGITAKEFIRNGFYGYRFKISTGSDRVTLETNQYDYSKSCDDAIKIFLSLMGDKATLDTERFTYHVNWR